MYPNQPQPQPQQTPIDYLNQIAPQAPKKINFTRKQWMLIGGLGLVLLIAIIIIIAGSLSGNSKPTEQLAARLATTAKIASDAQAKLKSTDLRALNSNLKIYLTNTNRDIVAPLAESHINIKTLDKKIVADESGAAMIAKLEDARLNAVYDNTYAHEMAYQLDTTMTLMKQIYNSTGNKDLKSFLDAAYTNLQPIQKQFASFNATNS